MKTTYNKILLQEARKYGTVEEFLTAKVSIELQELFGELYGHLSLTEAKKVAIDLYKIANSKNVKKEYYIKYNVGKVKYCLHYHTGLKVHNDGSKFWDIETFSSKKKLNQSIKELKLQGYKEI